MKIPAVFFGTAAEVRSRMRRLVTRVLRGDSLLQQLDGPMLDTDDVPKALIWTDSIKANRAADSKDFRIVLLSSTLSGARELLGPERRQLCESVAGTLEQSGWGTVLLNTHQGWWLGPIVDPSKTCVLAVLRGTANHWEELEGLGRRFCVGHEAERFAAPLVASFPRALGIAGAPVTSHKLPAAGPWTRETVWDDPRDVIRSLNLIERIEQDSAFWAAILREQGGPPPEAGNEAEIADLCSNGSWQKKHWDFLRASRGDAAVEAALKTLRERGDRQKLLGVLVHGVSDMARATQLFFEHRDDSELSWAKSRIAQHLRTSDALQAATLLIEDAEAHLAVGKPSVYRRSAQTLLDAREILVAAGLESEWAQQIDAFKARHGRRRALLAQLEKKSI